MNRRTVVYYAWDARRGIDAPLEAHRKSVPDPVELRRILYPRYVSLSDPYTYEQRIAGLFNNVPRQNFLAFTQRARAGAGTIEEFERVRRDGTATALGPALLTSATTLLLISFDSFRTQQKPASAEVAAVRQFLGDPDHRVFARRRRDPLELHGRRARAPAPAVEERTGTSAPLRCGDKASADTATRRAGAFAGGARRLSLEATAHASVPAVPVARTQAGRRRACSASTRSCGVVTADRSASSSRTTR